MARAQDMMEVEKEPGVPGFECIFVLISLLAVAYLIRRRGE
jgi:PGF-CTERM protein